MKTLCRILSLAAVAVTNPSLAEDVASTGEAVIEQWCRDCHLRADDPPDPVMAPPFEEIVMREGRDRAYFWQFLHEDHFPMPIFRLFEHEKEDVVAWLMGLQKRLEEEDD